MRKTFILDKGWKIAEEIAIEHNRSHSESYSTSKAGGCAGPASISYDDSAWNTLDVPHDKMCETEFSTEASHSHGYKKGCDFWYRKTFKMDKAYEGYHFMLCFEGVSVFSEIYVNGSLLERSYSAYCEINIDITDRIHFGSTPNVIAVHIDGNSEEGWWYEGAGIYRHVRLYAKPPLHIAHNGLWVKPVLKSGNDWTVELETEIENSAYTDDWAVVNACISDNVNKEIASVKCVGVCNENGVTTLKCSLDIDNPMRWDIDSPNLYKAVFELYKDGEVIDTDEITFGFREFYVDAEKGFFLNGRHVLIKGTCNHQDHAGVGVAVPDSVQYYRIRRLKEMGSNAYRCSHNMPSKEILDACDKYGLIVMDENRRFESSRDVINQVRTLIKRDRNHPSVIFYSLFNEEPLQNTNEGKRIFKRLRSEVEKLDNTRLITGAVNGVKNPEEGTVLDMDITGFNYGIDTIPEFHKNYPNQPVIGSENNSTISTRGCYKTDLEKRVLACYDEEKVPWGQTVKETWDLLRNNPYIAGLFVWTGFDYRGEPTPFKYPAVSSQFGVMDTCGFAKDGFYFNKACFTDEPIIHIIPHWNFNSGDTVRVMTVTNCEEAELFLNGKSLGRQKSDVCKPCEWNVAFEKGSLTAKGYDCSGMIVEETIYTTDEPYAIELEPQMNTIKNDGADTAVINVYAVDKNGRRVPTADNFIEFNIEGGGKILGVGNGDPQCLEADNQQGRSLFNGCCQVLVQSKEGTEYIKLIARSDNLKTAEYIFNIQKTEDLLYIYNEDCRIISAWTMSKTFPERPNPYMVIGDDDMNSFEAIDLQTSFQNYTEGYKVYRAFVSVSDKQEQKIVFPTVISEEFEVFVNGEQCADIINPEREKSIEVKINLKTETKNEIRIVCKARGGIPSGIKGDVVITD